MFSYFNMKTIFKLRRFKSPHSAFNQFWSVWHTTRHSGGRVRRRRFHRDRIAIALRAVFYARNRSRRRTRCAIALVRPFKGMHASLFVVIKVRFASATSLQSLPIADRTFGSTLEVLVGINMRKEKGAIRWLCAVWRAANTIQRRLNSWRADNRWTKLSEGEPAIAAAADRSVCKSLIKNLEAWQTRCTCGHGDKEKKKVWRESFALFMSRRKNLRSSPLIVALALNVFVYWCR